MDLKQLNQPRPRINGSMFDDFVDKSVCVLGIASDTDESGTSFTLTASDNVKIRVLTDQPLQEPLQGLIEIHGVVKDANELQCLLYILFPDTHNFDMESYNKAVKLSNKHPEHYITAE